MVDIMSIYLKRQRKINVLCCVPKCHQSNEDGISFHLFPNDEKRRRTWIEALKIKSRISKYHRVCGRHFQLSDYILPGVPTKRACLKKNAVPSAKYADRTELELNLNAAANEAERNKSVTDKRDKHGPNSSEEITVEKNSTVAAMEEVIPQDSTVIAAKKRPNNDPTMTAVKKVIHKNPTMTAMNKVIHRDPTMTAIKKVIPRNSTVTAIKKVIPQDSTGTATKKVILRNSTMTTMKKVIPRDLTVTTIKKDIPHDSTATATKKVIRLNSAEVEAIEAIMLLGTSEISHDRLTTKADKPEESNEPDKPKDLKTPRKPEELVKPNEQEKPFDELLELEEVDEPEELDEDEMDDPDELAEPERKVQRTPSMSRPFVKKPLLQRRTYSSIPTREKLKELLPLVK